MKIFITSGGTDVPIDDVRKITNMSSGKYGAEIAEDFYLNGHDVGYFGKKGGAVPKSQADLIYQGRNLLTSFTFSNFSEYLECVNLVRNDRPDIVISAAAVSDYIYDKVDGKISSYEDEIFLRLKKAPKVLPLLREAAPEALLVGFKLLVSPSDQEVYEAVKKVFSSGSDLVVYNDLTRLRSGDTSRLVFSPDMTFVKVNSSKELTEFITKYYNENKNSGTRESP